MSDSKDLWELGQVKGRQDERERIIKLLEELEAVGSNPITFDYINTQDLIALIKGENK